jgi:peptidoglycan/LPS O-acetylase OafA/YrhL
MTTSTLSQSQRIAWLEAIRIVAAVFLLLYHAQLLFTGYSYTPTPTGLAENLQQMFAVTKLSDRDWWWQLITIPSWFGYQFVDVFVLLSGFSLVLSLKGKPLETGSFLKKRLLRILWPFWTVAWLSYPVLWAIGQATDSYTPNLWHIFAGITFPLIFDYSGDLLLRTSGPWWFVPLILSFALLFPFLWKLLQRWGEANLLWVSLMLTLAYRVLAVYFLGGHPTYVILDTTADWQPFVLFLSKLSTFVLGMVVGQAYEQGRGPLLWSAQRALLVGFPVYVVGFMCQFYRLGWVVVDLLLPIGLTLLCMMLFRAIARPVWIRPALVWLGAQSYSYYLVHNFVVDRTVKLVIRDDATLYTLLLPVMVVGTLVLAMIVNAATPILQGILTGLLRDLDFVLRQSSNPKHRSWVPQVGDAVKYRGRGHWKVVKIERLLDEQEMLLCQVSDGQRSLWVDEEDLSPSENSAAQAEANSRPSLQ